jgi:hypothetical protein
MREHVLNPKLKSALRVLAVIAAMVLVVWVFHHFAIRASEHSP